MRERFTWVNMHRSTWLAIRSKLGYEQTWGLLKKRGNQNKGEWTHEPFAITPTPISIYLTLMYRIFASWGMIMPQVCNGPLSKVYNGPNARIWFIFLSNEILQVTSIMIKYMHFAAAFIPCSTTHFWFAECRLHLDDFAIAKSSLSADDSGLPCNSLYIFFYVTYPYVSPTVRFANKLANS